MGQREVQKRDRLGGTDRGLSKNTNHKGHPFDSLRSLRAGYGTRRKANSHGKTQTSADQESKTATRRLGLCQGLLGSGGRGGAAGGAVAGAGGDCAADQDE